MDADISADELNFFFKSIFTKNDEIMPLFEPPSFPNLEDVVLTVEKFFNLLNQIDTKKCAGPAGICNMSLRRYSDPISNCLYVIFTASLSLGFLPSNFRRQQN